MRKEAMLYEKKENDVVHCFLCAHRCAIAPSKFGVCAVRENDGGTLYTHTYGTVVAENVDPIEKKPLFHVLPGSRSFSIAAIGCNFRCAFCQNWQISQAREARDLGIKPYGVQPGEVVGRALANRCQSIAYTYTEPTIFFEFAYDVSREAAANDLLNIFVTNGFMTGEALETIRPYLHAANVDLKYFRDESYRQVCGGRLTPVLETIRRMHDAGIWVEVTTLIIPGENDSDGELSDIASFIAGVGKEIPWHISVFHPDYKLTDLPPTPPSTLQRAFEIGKKAGLRYVYKGNVAGEENTYCYNCNELLIRRVVFEVLEQRLDGNRCPRCHSVIDGLFVKEKTAT